MKVKITLKYVFISLSSAKVKNMGSINVDVGIIRKNTNPYSKIFFPKKFILENGYAAIAERKSAKVADETAMIKLFNVQRNGRPEKVVRKFSVVILVGNLTIEVGAGSTEARRSQLKGMRTNINIISKEIWMAVASKYLIYFLSIFLRKIK